MIFFLVRSEKKEGEAEGEAKDAKKGRRRAMSKNRVKGRWSKGLKKRR